MGYARCIHHRSNLEYARSTFFKKNKPINLKAGSLVRFLLKAFVPGKHLSIFPSKKASYPNYITRKKYFHFKKQYVFCWF